MNDSGTAQKEMPRYWCHKTVHALKIKTIVFNPGNSGEDGDGSVTIVPENAAHDSFIVDYEWYTKHTPKVDGYYVLYDDGYTSFSPPGPFEGGYSLIEPSGHGVGLKTRKDADGVDWHSLDIGELDLEALKHAVKFTLDNCKDHGDGTESTLLCLRQRLRGDRGTIQ